MNALSTPKEELISRIEASLDSIRPYLEADGGNIRITEVTEDHVLKLEFQGNCSSCPMSSMTFKAGVEEAVKRLVPEIKSIQVINLD
ncbi:MAG: NifU family protein [Bacteroidetes bacterium]|nr:NifU family protein [Bacteroidota bacterium]